MSINFLCLARPNVVSCIIFAIAFSVLPSKAFCGQFTGAVTERSEMCQKLTAKECAANDNCLTRHGPSMSKGNAVTADYVYKGCTGSRLELSDIQLIKDECSRVNGNFVKEDSYYCICTSPDNKQKHYCLEDFIMQINVNKKNNLKSK